MTPLQHQSRARYRELLQRKASIESQSSMTSTPVIHSALSTFAGGFQANVVRWACDKGRAALFMDTGLGKTCCQLAWASNVPGRVLILAPLAVAQQTKREALDKLGMDITHSRDGKAGPTQITITNYEQIEKFDLSQFAGVVLDESSILKSLAGKTKALLVSSFARHKYRLACTATPAPNDYTELGNHSDFLGQLESSIMLAKYFIHDSANTKDWRLKGHAVEPFWRWIGSWAACVGMPSDAGGIDDAHKLPPLTTETHTVDTQLVSCSDRGLLFDTAGVSATSIHKDKSRTLNERVERAVQLVKHTNEPFIMWCQKNDESEMLADALGDECVEVHGGQTSDKKEELLEAFGSCNVRGIVSKPKICGFGLNWQHCNHQVFASIDYSYESFYQAVRRSWRFGQMRPVKADVVMAPSEEQVWKAILDKSAQHDQMKQQMRHAVISHQDKGLARVTYQPRHTATLADWIKTN